MSDLLHEHDAALIRAVAHNVPENSKWLVAPHVDMRLEWFKSDLARRFFQAVVSLLMQNRTPDFITLITLVCKDRGEADLLRTLFREGRSSATVDLSALVGVLKTDYMARSAEVAIAKYIDSVKSDPNGVQRHIDALNVTLSSIARGSDMYDPRPSQHLNDKDLRLVGSWGSEGLDSLCDGGRLAFGFFIGTAPSGHGKTTLGRTLAIQSIILKQRAIIMSNEMPASHYSNTILQALRYMYRSGTDHEERSETDLISDLDQYMAVYENVTSFESVARYLYWERPQLAILDSINAVDSPDFASRYNENSQHQAKADTLLQYTRRFDTFMYAPGNMSQMLQQKLISKPGSVKQVMLFGSVSYHNASDGAFVSWRDPARIGQQNFEIVKNRRTGRIGYRVAMHFDTQSQSYISGNTQRPLDATREAIFSEQPQMAMANLVDDFPVED